MHRNVVLKGFVLLVKILIALCKILDRLLEIGHVAGLILTPHSLDGTHTASTKGPLNLLSKLDLELLLKFLEIGDGESQGGIHRRRYKHRRAYMY
jgi:hypothetical protein